MQLVGFIGPLQRPVVPTGMLEERRLVLLPDLPELPHVLLGLGAVLGAVGLPRE